MKWFKHKSNMRNDIKLKRVINRYGLEGYGLYNLILESIVESLETESPLPILQDNVDDIATFYNANSTHIAEMVSFMVNQGLFDFTENNEVICVKVYKYLQSSQTRSKQIRELITSFNTKMLLPETVSDNCEEQNRTEQNRQEENITENKRSKPKKYRYGEYKHVLLTKQEYENLKVKVNNVDKYITDIDESIEEKGNIYHIKNFNLAIQRWYKRDKERNKNDVDIYNQPPLKEWREVPDDDLNFEELKNAR